MSFQLWKGTEVSPPHSQSTPRSVPQPQPWGGCGAMQRQSQAAGRNIFTRNFTEDSPQQSTPASPSQYNSPCMEPVRELLQQDACARQEGQESCTAFSCPSAAGAAQSFWLAAILAWDPGNPQELPGFSEEQDENQKNPPVPFFIALNKGDLGPSPGAGHVPQRGCQ